MLLINGEPLRGERVNPFLPPKHYKYGGHFSLLLGYNIYPSSSSTNQNAALIIDHMLDFTKIGYCMTPSNANLK